MRRLIMPAFAALALCTANPALAGDGVKIASVDVRKVAFDSKAGAEATRSLSKLADKLGGNLKAKQAELEKIKDTLDGKGKKLSVKERAAKEKEIQKKIGQYRDMTENAQKELQAKEEELGGRIMAGIEKSIKEYAAKNGYGLVIRKADIVYTDGKQEITDVTDDILKAVDAAPAAAKK